MTFKEINEKYGQNPSVITDMQNCTSTEEAYKTLVEKYGYTGTVEDLLREATDIAKINPDITDGELDEEMLGTVVGGGGITWEKILQVIKAALGIE